MSPSEKSEDYLRYLSPVLADNLPLRRLMGSPVMPTADIFVAPNMTTAQRDAISVPGTGTVILNTSTGKLNFYTGSAWEAVTSV